MIWLISNWFIVVRIDLTHYMNFSDVDDHPVGHACPTSPPNRKIQRHGRVLEPIGLSFAVRELPLSEGQSRPKSRFELGSATVVPCVMPADQDHGQSPSLNGHSSGSQAHQSTYPSPIVPSPAAKCCRTVEMVQGRD